MSIHQILKKPGAIIVLKNQLKKKQVLSSPSDKRREMAQIHMKQDSDLKYTYETVD
jgi:hypothetical protein